MEICCLRWRVFSHDTAFSRRTIKYSNLLLEIEDPYFPSSSTYSDYWQLMKPLNQKNVEGKNITVCSSLSEWLVFKDDPNPIYLASAGIRNPRVLEFVPHKRLYQRQIYSAAPYWYSSIPSSFEKVQTNKRVYFICTDASNSRARFESANSSLMINMVLEFHSLEQKASPLENLFDLITRYKTQKFQFEEFKRLANSHSVIADDVELLFFLENSPFISRQERKRTGIMEYSFKSTH